MARLGNIEFEVNVFDSSDISSTKPNPDADLGSPNRRCGGPGIGSGGVPTSKYPNCDEQGNLLIIQNTDNQENDPNDSPDGGCITLEFSSGIELVNMGLLDVEERTEIKVRLSEDKQMALGCCCDMQSVDTTNQFIFLCICHYRFSTVLIQPTRISALTTSETMDFGSLTKLSPI
jgi:hypothetical protein